MKLHKYLEQVLGNKGSISVLRTLVSHTGAVFTIRRLAEDAGISHTEAASTIEDLEKIGIVTVQPIGRSHQISLNQKSYILNKIIEPIFKVEQNSLQEVSSVLKKNLSSKKIISAVIFGSVIRNEEKEDSDIDVLIISNDPDHAIEQVAAASRQVFSIFHGKVSHIIFSEKQFRVKRNSDLIRSVIKDHILIAGKKLEDVMK